MATAPSALRFAPGRSLRVDKPAAELYEDAIRRGEGIIAADGPLVVRTGRHTGRSPLDKFIVDEPTTRDHIWWGPVNRPISEADYDRLRSRLVAYLADRDLYVQHASIGAAPGHRRALRVYTETAWASLFARNLFRRADARRRDPRPRLHDHLRPVVQGRPGDRGDPHRDRDPRPPPADGGHHRRHRVRRRDQEVGLHGHELPAARRGRAARCTPRSTSARRATRSIFFGLSGTGKTTLSADPRRSLIGDDEHGWGDDGVFNFEGGCYAKTIRLSPMYEPDIFQTTRRFGTVLENVDLDPRTRELDLDIGALHREHARRLSAALHRQRRPDRRRGPAAQRGVPDRRRVRGHAADLAADPRAGRLPLHQRLHRQAGRHRGRASRSPAPRSPRASGRRSCRATRRDYAAMLTERLERYDVPVWLVNTGWTGGPYGTGERMDIAHTRSMVRAAIDGRLDGVPMRIDPIFGFEVPLELPRRAVLVPGPARDLGRPRRLRPPGRSASPGCSRPISRPTPGWSRPRSSPPARQSTPDAVRAARRAATDGSVAG